MNSEIRNLNCASPVERLSVNPVRGGLFIATARILHFLFVFRRRRVSTVPFPKRRWAQAWHLGISLQMSRRRKTKRTIWRGACVAINRAPLAGFQALRATTKGVLPTTPLCLALTTLLLVSVLLSGCKQSRVEQALDSDANGYLCGACQAKFYTERKVFADVCPKCKSPQLVQAMGYICTADGHVTVAGRGRSSVPCEKCGQPASGLSIPREADLRAWGAAKKTQREVGGS